MPTLLKKQPVLDGRAEVFAYARNPRKWFYREYNPQTQRYRSRLIPGVTTLEDAVGQALDMYGLMRGEGKANAEPQVPLPPPHLSGGAHIQALNTGGAHFQNEGRSNPKSAAFQNRKRKGKNLQDCINDWLTFQSERMEAGVITPGTFKEKSQTLGVHLSNYFKERGIGTTAQIQENTFEGYLYFRKHCKKRSTYICLYL